MEIDNFFRNLSPNIQRSMWELPIICIPGRERILACSILELQIKKGRGSSLVFSICTIEDRYEVSTKLFLQLQVTEYLGSHHSGLTIPIFLSMTVGIVGNLLTAIVCSHFLYYFTPTQSLSLRSSSPHATFKGLNLKFNYALLGQ